MTAREPGCRLEFEFLVGIDLRHTKVTPDIDPGEIIEVGPDGRIDISG